MTEIDAVLRGGFVRFNTYLVGGGTGYSSLAYLSRLPVDVVKVDRSFVALLPHDNRVGELVRGLVSLAHALELEVVGEGVETAAQADFLRAIGCDWQQGFLHARPLEAADATAYLVKHSASDSASNSASS